MRKYILINANVNGGGGGNVVPKYVRTFNSSSDWTLDGDFYKITINENIHNQGDKPFIIVLDSSNEVVQTGIEISNLGNVTISVKSNPDLRFQGRIFIS